MTTEHEITLPSWAQVGDKRRKHIDRVVALLDQWAEAMQLSSAEHADWRAAGIHHDALRDAPEDQLRHLAGDSTREVEILHGPAVAMLLHAKGGFSPGVLSAIRYHTVGSPEWDRTGRALFMADFLEPGRNFARRDRAFLAAQVPTDFDGVFRQVLRARLEHSLREGFSLFPETVDLWNAVR